MTEEEATSEDMSYMKSQFPTFFLEDKEKVQGEGIVMMQGNATTIHDKEEQSIMGEILKEY
ncbi:conserved hypothetical protein [Ricinus communis]|uniref:Uncharacterized protein n=1 Tax=Ricinus communis TaxID=3988 RepID=B9SMJ9_RICCO|nr:conserved hypothetical protein [Ricinus communis]